MAERFEERLPREVRGWVSDGIIDEDQGETILARHPPSETDRSWARDALHGAAAVLLGAAGIALVMVGFDPDEPALPLTLVGLALSGLGLVLFAMVPRDRRPVAEAVLTAGLAPLAVAVFAPGPDATGWVALGVALALLLWRYRSHFVAVLSFIALTVATGGLAFELFETEEAASWAWAGAQFVWLGIVVGLDTVWTRQPRVSTGVLAVAGLAVSGIVFFSEGLGLDSSETIELLVGVVFLALVGLALAIGHAGVLVGAVIGLSIDAIVFAFDVGGVLLGVGLLVALAGVLVWQADRLREAVAART